MLQHLFLVLSVLFSLYHLSNSWDADEVAYNFFICVYLKKGGEWCLSAEELSCVLFFTFPTCKGLQDWDHHIQLGPFPCSPTYLNALHALQKQPLIDVFFFGSTGVWTQGLLLKPLHKSFFVMGLLKVGSCKLFAQAGFKPRSSLSLPPEYVGVQVWATGSWPLIVFKV
jgi:hypothetical protein